MHKIIEKSFASTTLLFLALTLFAPLAYAAPLTPATKCVTRSAVSALNVDTLVGVSTAIPAGTELPSTTAPYNDAAITSGFGVICTFALVQQIFEIFFLVVATISVVIILYSAYLFLTSAGDSKKTTSARDYLMYAVVGIVLAVVAKIVPSAVIGFLGTK